MSKAYFSQIEVLACLLNGCHIVWRQRVGPGSDTYSVMLPQGIRPDKCLGRISGSTFSMLMQRGFLSCDEPPRTDKSGDYLYFLPLGKPKLPRFVLEVTPDA